jgi:hypothetical protein
MREVQRQYYKDHQEERGCPEYNQEAVTFEE